MRRWVSVVPISFAIAIAASTDFADLAEKGIGFVVLLLLGALCVGFAEEGRFRGIGVTVLRVNGLSEGRVALWSSVVFGAVHLTNALSTGGSAVGQAIAVSFAGYFFYLTRRVAGGLIVPAVIHGMFDFSILSGAVAGDATYAGSIAAILAYPVVGRHPARASPPRRAQRRASPSYSRPTSREQSLSLRRGRCRGRRLASPC